MKYTSKTAGKRIQQLNTEKRKLMSDEGRNRTYSYFYGETPNIPDYDFAKTCADIESINDEIIKLKHAINQFNLTTTLPTSGLTIDKALVRMAMLSERIDVLRTMRSATSTRRTAGSNGVSEFTQNNYAYEDAEAMYQKLYAEQQTLQHELDVANMEIVFEVED